MVTASPTTCVGAVCHDLAQRLTSTGRDDADHLVRLLVSDALACSAMEVPLRYEEHLSAEQVRELELRAERLASGEPLQYVVGWTEFMGLRLNTDARALVPRPETEGLVERVLATEAIWMGRTPDLVDVGTGSGCVVLALAHSGRPGRYVGVDSSAAALSLAAENARATGLHTSVELRRGDLLDGFEPESIDVVVANLPYVTEDEWPGLPRDVRDHEPRAALVGGMDGLDILRRLVLQASQVLRSDGWLFVEMGETQGLRLAEEMVRNGFVAVEVLRDMAGRERYVRGRRG